SAARRERSPLAPGRRRGPALYGAAMKTRPLGKTGLVVSELALGTWGLSGDAYGPIAEADRDQVIARARAFGITLFDTADTYGRGEMERALGRLLGEDAGAQFVTKIGTELGGP